MPSAEIQLLGGFSIRAGKNGTAVLPTKKARALVAYLALPAGRFHSREKLTALLWGESPATQAQQSLRQALWAIRRVFGDGSSRALATESDAIALRPSEVTVDATDFQHAATDPSLAGLEQAASLYRGDLLDGLGVDEPPFDEWRVAERERLRELALAVLARLLGEQLRLDIKEAAIQTALRLIGMDPLQEAVQRTLMRLYIDQGRRSAALRQYQHCVGWLASELGTEPEGETQELYRTILRTSVPVAARPAKSMAPGARTPQTPSSESPFVGRASELEAIIDAVDGIFDEGPRVTILSGESGIGKTRLIHELAASSRTEGFQLFSAWCHATEQALPLRPWIDALRGERSSLPPWLVQRLTAQARVQLNRVFPELASPRDHIITTGDCGPLFEALRDLIEALAGRQPAIIVLEDLHWCDDMSARLLAFLGRRLTGLPIVIIGTMRPEDVAPGSVFENALAELRNAGQLNQIALTGLDRVNTLELAYALCRGRGDSTIIDRIGGDVWTLSEGNPFVIVETLRAVTTPEATGAAGGLRLATTVRDAVSRRLARLPEQSQRVLEAAAVIGRSFEFRLLRHVAELEERACAVATEDLVRHRVLEAIGERLAFSHERIRRVAYDNLLAPRRALLHRAVALALESSHRERLDDVADELGQHFLQAGDLPKALEYMVTSSEIAGQRYALDSALRMLEQASKAAHALAEPERDRSRLDVELRRAVALTRLGRHRECIELVCGLTSLQQRVADAALTSEYFRCLALSHAYLGAYTESRTAGGAALSAAERSGSNDCIGKALFALASSSYLAGLPREAISFGERAVALLERSHARYWLGVTHWNLAANYHLAGDFSSALAHSARCEQVADALGDYRLRSLADTVRSRVHCSLGDYTRAVECAEQAVATSRDPIASFAASRALGQAQLEMGEVDAAIRTLETILDAPLSGVVQLTAVWGLSNLGDAYLAAGQTDRALSVARRAKELNADVSIYNDGLIWRVLGRIASAQGQVAAACERLSRALEAFERCGATFEAARTHLDLARVAVRLGTAEEVQRHLTTAIAAFGVVRAPKRRAEALALAVRVGARDADTSRSA